MSDFIVRWNSRCANNNFYTDRDYNETIVTKINQIAASIFSKSLRNGPDTLEVASNLMDIIEYLTYYDRHRGILGGKYKVIVRDDWNSVIKVSSSQHDITGTVLVDGLGEIIEGDTTKNYFYLLIK